MKKLQKIYLPGTAISFMLTILMTAAINILSGRGTHNYGFYVYVFELFGFLVAVEGIDYLLSFINFKTHMHYFISELVIIYVFLLGVGYAFHWIDFSVSGLFLVTIFFISIYSFIHWHFYKLFKQEAEYMNELIENRNKNFNQS
jgi:hypothetical protein